jgi:hypothetical protein
MIERLNQHIDNLENWIRNAIPESEFKSKTTTFHITDLGSGQIANVIVDILKSYNHSDKNINDRVSGVTNDIITLWYFKETIGCLGKYDFEEKFKEYTSDWVITLPSIKESNDNYEILKSLFKMANKGVLYMMSAKSIFDKTNKYTDTKLKTMLNKYATNITICNPTIYGGTASNKNGLPLSFTLFEMYKSNSKVKVNDTILNTIFEYESVNDITIYGNDKTFFKIKNKVLNYCKEFGSLSDIVNTKRGRLMINLPKQRGHGSSVDYYTPETLSFYSNDSNKNYGIVTTKREGYYSIDGFNETNVGNNILDYLTNSPIARFGLSLFKYDISVLKTTFNGIPLFDFNKKVTEKIVKEKLKLTNLEMKWIEKKMKKYM